MISEEKSLLRRHYREIRNNITGEYASYAALELIRNCVSVVDFSKSIVVSGYEPLDGEIDISPLMKYIEECGCEVVVPVVEKGSRLLSFKNWNCKERSFEKMLPSVLLVPLIAFDKKLNRLGFGGGYYDCTLSHLKRMNVCKCIGIAYDVQLCEQVPVLEHDQKLDLVVTEKTVYSV